MNWQSLQGTLLTLRITHVNFSRHYVQVYVAIPGVAGRTVQSRPWLHLGLAFESSFAESLHAMNSTMVRLMLSFLASELEMLALWCAQMCSLLVCKM